MNDYAIEIRATSDRSRAERALSRELSFGSVFADLMVMIHHHRDRGWHDGAIVPFGPLTLSPAAKVLHYGLEIFEGHKAYRWSEGDEIALFRPDLNARRLNSSAERMMLPTIPESLQLRSIEMLVDLIRPWVPSSAGSSLYLRPMLIGTQPSLGVSRSAEHLYLVLASPVGSYFAKGTSPISVLVEENDVRAARGGVGAAKTGGNYAAGLAAQQRAQDAGYDQVLWLDGIERRYIEELNAMNVFVVQGRKLLTPPAGGTILAGITRLSILELASELGLEPEERALAIGDLAEGIEAGRITEMFAAGTAAIVTSIGRIGYRGRQLRLGTQEVGPVCRSIRESIMAIQYGEAPDRHGWMRVVPHHSAHEVAAPIHAIA